MLGYSQRRLATAPASTSITQGTAATPTLSDLDGLTVWDQARLLEEGIEDMHALATANLVDLLLGTRVPVNTLVDWVDQALLYLCVPKKPRPCIWRRAVLQPGPPGHEAGRYTRTASSSAMPPLTGLRAASSASR